MTQFGWRRSLVSTLVATATLALAKVAWSESPPASQARIEGHTLVTMPDQQSDFLESGIAIRLTSDTSAPFSLYLGPGFAPPSGGGLGSDVSGSFALYLGPGLVLPTGGGLGSATSAAFALDLGRLREGFAVSESFVLDTRFATDAGDEGSAAALPRVLTLHPAHPNPFNARTSIHFDLPAGGLTRLTIFDVRGQLVRRLVATTLPPGFHAVDWDGADERGRAVASGVYFYGLEAEGRTLTRKLTVLK